MHSIKSLMKRFSTIFLALAMAIGCSVSAFAAEPTDVLSAEPAAIASEADVASGEASTRDSLGKVLATATTTIHGGSGSLYVYLPAGNFWADFVAQIGYTSESGVVSCSVTMPDGTYINLGSISGTGARTFSQEVFYAPAGNYIFYFTSALTSSYDVIGYIYD